MKITARTKSELLNAFLAVKDLGYDSGSGPVEIVLKRHGGAVTYFQLWPPRGGGYYSDAIKSAIRNIRAIPESELIDAPIAKKKNRMKAFI